MTDVPQPPHCYRGIWTPVEEAVIRSYGEACAKAERERCAQLALKHTTHKDDPDNCVWQAAYNHVAGEIAQAIRAGLDAPSPARSDLGVPASPSGSVVASLPSIPDANCGGLNASANPEN